MKIVESVCRVLASLEAPYALIGGRAVGARGYPRMTLDYDFLASDRRVLDAQTWQELVVELGASIDTRKGDVDDPIAGVCRISCPDGSEADVLLARWKWESEILERAEPLDLGATIVPVPLTSDLILLKLAAGGPIDLQDVVMLLEGDRERLIAEVSAKIERLPSDVVAAWERIRG